MKKYFTCLSVAFTIAVSYNSSEAVEVRQSPDCGKIERIQVYAPTLQENMDIDVWLPEGYNTESSYPVIYMHDGQNLYDANSTWNHQAWEMDRTACELIAAGEVKPFIIVGIHSDPDRRVSQLMPEKAVKDAGLEDLMDEVKLKGKPVMGDEYAEFVVNTLKPLIDSTYSTSSDLENTYVMGSSMGGLMSLYLISEYPEVFGGAGCLSTHWYGSLNAGNKFGDAMMKYIESKIPDPSDHRLYFDHGTTTIDQYYGPWETKALLIVQEKGYIYGVNLDSYIDYGAPHEESAWSARVARPLKFLLNH